MKKNSSFPILIFAAILAIGGATAYATYRVSPDFKGLWILGGAVLLASFASSAIQVADQWSKAVVLRLRVEENAVGCRFSLALSAVSSFVRV